MQKALIQDDELLKKYEVEDKFSNSIIKGF